MYHIAFWAQVIENSWPHKIASGGHRESIVILIAVKIVSFQPRGNRTLGAEWPVNLNFVYWVNITK